MNFARVAIALALTAMACHAQVKLNQLKGLPSDRPEVLLVLPDGSLAQATLADGITVDTTGAKPIVRAVQSTPARVFNADLTLAGTRATFGTATTRNYVVASLEVHRNGVLQKAGLDFDVDLVSGAIVFKPGAIPSADDVLTASFQPL